MGLTFEIENVIMNLLLENQNPKLRGKIEIENRASNLDRNMPGRAWNDKLLFGSMVAIVYNIERQG